MHADVRLRWVLLVTSAATFVASLDLFVVNVAFGDLQREFHQPDPATLSWVLNGYTIVLAALPIPFGRFADTYGRLRWFVAGMVLFAAASALCAAAPSLTWLIAARVVQGVGAAALLPTSLGLLLGEFPPHRRAAAVATWAATGSVAAAFGTPVGALLTRVDWRLIFLINVPIVAVTLLIARRVLTESRAEAPAGMAGLARPTRPDLFGTALLTAGIALVTLGLVQANDWGWGSARTLGALVGGLVLVAAFLWQCTRHRAPVLELDLFRDRQFSAATLATTLLFTGFGALLLGNVLLLTDLWHQDVLAAGLEFAPAGVVSAIVAMFFAARLAARYGYRVLGAAGCLTIAASMVAYCFSIGASPDFPRDVLPYEILCGAGIGLVIPTLAAAISASLPAARRATGSAVFAMARQLGTVLGVGAMVALMASSSGHVGVSHYQRVWIFIAAVEVVAALACLLLPARTAGVARSVPAARLMPAADSSPAVVGASCGQPTSEARTADVGITAS
ncbi:Major facilitator superfamily (MFS) profile domain-containing protein [Frankia sp. AiPs1]|uniref:MFS transporter n=1 Tax=Frankia sp. AiPa1 TaxID=573492 RepID=UPI00202B4F4B|nr:MFS transporter [Frankia sp. AiPa1]MCL9758368.1 MFS transporter [Frankia sp. AiPa1]